MPQRPLPPNPSKAPSPTRHQPGTPGKIQVLHDRCWSGVHLWHPRDAERDDEATLNLDGVSRLLGKVFAEKQDGSE